MASALSTKALTYGVPLLFAVFAVNLLLPFNAAAQLGGLDLPTSLAAPPAHGKDQLREQDTLREQRNGTLLSEKQAAQRARDEFGGRVLSVNLRGDHYKIKLISKGVVRVVRVNAYE